MSNPKACRYEVLARSGAAVVRCCSECHSVSVDLGPMTFRLDEAGLQALWTVLGEAAAELRSRGDSVLPTVAHRGAA